MRFMQSADVLLKYIELSKEDKLIGNRLLDVYFYKEFCLIIDLGFIENVQYGTLTINEAYEQLKTRHVNDGWSVITES